MDLKTFVAETLCQIMAGVTDARKQHRDTGSDGTISPQFELRGNGDAEGQLPLVGVDFDVAVTVVEEAGKKGGIGVVGGLIGFGASAESKAGNQTVSRIRFKIPVKLPGVDGQVKET